MPESSILKESKQLKSGLNSSFNTANSRTKNQMGANDRSRGKSAGNYGGDLTKNSSVNL